MIIAHIYTRLEFDEFHQRRLRQRRSDTRFKIRKVEWIEYSSLHRNSENVTTLNDGTKFTSTELVNQGNYNKGKLNARHRSQVIEKQ